MHIENVPGGTACAARLTGSVVDTMLMLNRSGQLILVAGRSDWRASGPEEVSLRIDGFELDHLQGNAFNNLVLVLIRDETVVKRLMAAKELDWTLPSGTYQAYPSVNLRLSDDTDSGDTLRHTLTQEYADDAEPTFAFQAPRGRPSLVGRAPGGPA